MNICFAQKTNPPGTIWLRDNLYIDRSAINNVGYKEYEYCMGTFLKYNLDSFQIVMQSTPYFGLNSKLFFKNLHLTPNPDSTDLKINRDDSIAWEKPESFEFYLNHPSYNNYPLVNISHEQAKIFCAWRTAMVQLVYSESTTKRKRQKLYRKVRYRLATKEEWEFALSKFSGTENFIRLNGPFPAPRKKYTITNLAELTEEKSTLVNTEVNSKIPANLTTFRCICEVYD